MGRMTNDKLSRRRFLELTATGTALGVTSPMSVMASRPGSSGFLKVVASAPFLGPDRDLETFRAEVAATRKAGVNVVIVPVAGEPAHSVTLLENFLRLYRHVADTSGVEVPGQPEEFDTLISQEKLILLPSLNGMQMLPGGTAEEMLASLDGLRDMGVWVVRPIHNWKNRNGDGCFGRTNQGLTTTGRLALKRLNAAGVVVDLSSMGQRSSLEALDLVEPPVIFSGSNARHICEHPANLTDEQIDACARTGGVIGISAFPGFMSGSGQPTLNDLFRHVDYITERVGAEHVGLGLALDDRIQQRFPSDPIPDPPDQYPKGLERIDDFVRVRQGLAKRGYRSGEIDQILGGNFYRVFKKVWTTADDFWVDSPVNH